MAYVPVFFFFKVGQTSRSRLQGNKLWYHVNILVIMNTHVKYDSSTSCSMSVIANVKVYVHATDTDAVTRSGSLLNKYRNPCTFLLLFFTSMLHFLSNSYKYKGIYAQARRKQIKSEGTKTFNFQKKVAHLKYQNEVKHHKKAKFSVIVKWIIFQQAHLTTCSY